MPDGLTHLGNVITANLPDLNRSGLILPLKSTAQPLLTFKLEDKLFAVMLSGQFKFGFFQVSRDTRRTGIFFPDIEILVDFESATEAGPLKDTLGTLILQESSLSLVAVRTGEAFHDPQLIPLPNKVDGGSNVVEAAFSRWGIGIREGDGHRVLWQNPPSLAEE